MHPQILEVARLSLKNPKNLSCRKSIWNHKRATLANLWLQSHKGSAESQAQIFLPQLDRIFPGIKNLRQGEAIRAYWPGEQYTRASYACYLVGQWTSIAGAEQKRVGNLFFAGEHCSLSYQGYMEGGCATGEVAARRILKDLGLRNISAQQKKPINTNQLLRRHPRIPRDERFSDDYTQE